MVRHWNLALLLLAALLPGTPLDALARNWEPDRRLSFDPAASQLSPNFAWSVAADDAERVHVVWYDERDGSQQIYYRRSADAGVTWALESRLSTGPSAANPAVAAAGDYAYVAWHDLRDGHPAIYLRRSSDAGASWGPETRLSGGTGSAHSSLAANGPNLYVVWVDSRDGAGEVYFRASFDHGATWGVELRLSQPAFDSWVPTIAANGRDVYAAWVDTRDGNEEEYFRRSLDGGATWGPIVRVTDNGANSWAPTLAVSGNTVLLAWFDQQDSPVQPHDAEAILDRALDLLGLAHAPPPLGVMVDHPEQAARQRATEKLQQIQAAAPAWVAGGGDASRLAAILAEFNAMGPAGATYFAKERKLDEAMQLIGLAYVPGPPNDLAQIYYLDAQLLRVQDKLAQIVATGPAWVASGGSLAQLDQLLDQFTPAMEQATYDWEIYSRRSTDSGTTWEPIQRLTVAPHRSMRPSLAMQGDRAHLVWFDGRDGNSEIYYQESADRGLSWGSSQRLTDAPADSMHPTIAVAGDVAHVVWYDLRDGNAEIYTKRSVEEALPASNNLFDARRDGHGIDFVRVRDSLYALTFYTYDANGEPEWYQALGNMADGVFVPFTDASGKNLMRYRYDVENTPPQQQVPSLSGTVSLDFNNAVRQAPCNDGRATDQVLAIMTFSLGADQSVRWCMQPIVAADARATPDFSGLWHAGSQDDGWGWSILNFRSDDQNGLAAILFYYDAAGNSTWAYAQQAPFANDSSYPMVHRRAYCRTCATLPFNDQPAGTVTFGFTQPSETPAASNRIGFDLAPQNSVGGRFARTDSPLLLLTAPQNSVLGEFGDETEVTVLGYPDHAMEPFISSDGRTLFFNNLNSPSVNTDLHYAERVGTNIFEYRGLVQGVNTSSSLEGVPSMDRNGRFYFVSPRSYANTLSTIYVGNFANGAVSGIELVPGISPQIAGMINFDVEVRADGRELYFVDAQFDSSGPATADLVVADAVAGGFVRRSDSATVFGAVNTTALEYAAGISPDGLELFLTRAERSETGALLAPAIFRATRSSSAAPFGSPARIDAITGFAEGPTLTSDGRTLYYHKLDAGRFRIFRVVR